MNFYLFPLVCEDRRVTERLSSAAFSEGFRPAPGQHGTFHHFFSDNIILQRKKIDFLMHNILENRLSASRRETRAASTKPVRASVGKECDRRVFDGFDSRHSTKVFKIYEYGDNSFYYFRSLRADGSGKRISGHRPAFSQIW